MRQQVRKLVRGVASSHKDAIAPDSPHMKMLVAARELASTAANTGRLAFARAMTSIAIQVYWRERQHGFVEPWPIRKPPASIEMSSLTSCAHEVAQRLGIAAAQLEPIHASYLVGVLYTGTMPAKLRSELGAYYTPPALCERLLDMASDAGVDWRTAHVLDPACGGGAFLAPVAQRMLRSLERCSPKIALKNILHRLRGFELDPFAGWMSQVFLEATLLDLCRAAESRLPAIVEARDSLTCEPVNGSYDLVVGNPPYGRISLAPDLRRKFQRSLYGHANLYGLFTDLALRFARHGGVIAYVTPTSFLAGEYFKSLRGLLGREAPPASIDFIAERKGVFADVLQETLLAAYRRGGKPDVGHVHFISQAPDGSIEATSAGSFNLPGRPDQPWLVPRSKSGSKLIRGAQRMRHRLADYGYAVGTGPLVWNRHKSGLRDQPGRGRYPLIWAESVRSDGTFEYRAQQRNHKPYFEPSPDEGWVVTRFPCVLLQRTTAKEQARRLIAAEMPASFVAKYGAVVVENHLDMIRPKGEVTPSVSPAAVAALLNTAVVDELFRCVNGSVAVSAYELEALPLPSPADMSVIEKLVARRACRDALEQAVLRSYL
jgi:adenine-specific DNA-methyltransferase